MDYTSPQRWLFEGRGEQQRFFHRTWSHILGPNPDYPKSFTSKNLLSSGLLGDGADGKVHLGRVFFANTPFKTENYGDDLMIEIIITKKHHDIADSWALDGYLFANNSDELQDINPNLMRAIDSLKREIKKHKLTKYDMDWTPGFENVLDKYIKLSARVTRALNLLDREEIHLSPPINFKGNPRIVGIYKISDNKISEIVYNNEGSLNLNDVVGHS